MPTLAADPLKDLSLLIRSRYALIVLETVEEDRAQSLLRHLAESMNLPFFHWSRTKGLCRMDDAATAAPAPGDGTPEQLLAVYGSMQPAAALGHVEQSQFPALYHFEGLGDFLNDAVVAGKLKDAAEQFSLHAGAVVITGEGVVLPATLRAQAATVQLSPPDAGDYQALLQRIVRDLAQKQQVSVQLTQQDLNRLLENLRGLTLLEAEKVLTRAIVENGCLSRQGIAAVIAAKKTIIEREGLLEYYPTEENLGDIAGLAGLKAWLAKRREILANPAQAAAFGLSFPRGILLLGVQGCGKSLCAKAVAKEWELPLVKLDPSKLYNKYIGESERNFQRAIKLSEQMAPVVLWIDEIEKAFAQSSGDDDGGVSQRILGTLLGWLQDHKGDVFVVATANNIARLPPEFIRKGRFDEIFFVDLPRPEERRAIFEIHLRKRGHDPKAFDLAALTAASEGFSGAEIEQAVVSGLYTAFSAKAALDTTLLSRELSLTVPLSRTMGEQVAALREWARTRTVSAQ